MQIPGRLILPSIFLLAALPVSAGDFPAADVYRNASSSVVLIFGFDAKGQGSAGSGSIIDAEGLILTNDHVIFDARTGAPYADLEVYFKPPHLTGDSRRDLERSSPAIVVARDRALDLAVLRVGSLPQGARAIALGDSEAAEIGSPVAAIGHPGGGGLWTLTTGTISSVRREGNRDVFQTDAAINPGNSGGPLLDADARLIGVNTYVRRVNAKGLPLEGLNYSVRSSLVHDWLGRNGVEVAVSMPEIDSIVPARPAAPAPSPEPRSARPTRPRAYQGGDGSAHYGVPDPRFDPETARKDVFERSRRIARDAFMELDEMSIQLDDQAF